LESRFFLQVDRYLPKGLTGYVDGRKLNRTWVPVHEKQWVQLNNRLGILLLSGTWGKKGVKGQALNRFFRSSALREKKKRTAL